MTRQAVYGYDPDGLRLREQVTTTTGMTSTTEVRLLVADHLSLAGYVELIEERTESGLIVASYVYGAGLDPISVFRAGQPVGLYVPDGHSGVRQVVDLAVVAAVLAAYRYDAFGNKVATMGAFADVVGYRGERLDTVLGQYYQRARIYDPKSGRFTSMDQYQGSLLFPVSLHKYSYGNSDPISFLDPTGQFGLLATVGLAAFVKGDLRSADAGARIPVVKQALALRVLAVAARLAQLARIAPPPPAPPSRRKRGDACHKQWPVLLAENPHLERNLVSVPQDNHGQRFLFPEVLRTDAGIMRIEGGTSLPIPGGTGTTGFERDWVRLFGLPGDEAGHVIAQLFGGRADVAIGNIVPLARGVNNIASPSPLYTLQEGRVAAYVRAGQTTCFEVRFSYGDPTHPLRPSHIVWTIMHEVSSGTWVTDPPAAFPNA
jgi:RHS repeat-associated protein